jgi:DNA repair protein RadC
MPTKKYAVSDTDLLSEDGQLKTYTLKLRDLPEEERPRERLLKHGVAALSSPELLAILLTTGTKKEDVLSLSKRILKEYGEKGLAFERNPKNLAELDIPPTKASQIIACFELGRRFFDKQEHSAPLIRTSKQAYEYLEDMGKLSKEHLLGLYLNSRFRIIHDEVISIGNLTANIIHPREVFQPAIERGAVAVIIAHNHPSGSSLPTKSDRIITEQLVSAGAILGIELLDHLVIGKNSFSSLLG